MLSVRLGSTVIVLVAGGMYSGVGDRTTGIEEEDTIGVLIGNWIIIPLHEGNRKIPVKTRMVFLVTTFDYIIVSEIKRNTIVFLHKMCENRVARRWLPPSASDGYLR